MLALGIILILLATGAVVAALFGASPETSTFDLGVFSLEMDTLGVFFFGAGTVVLLAIGLWLVRAGLRRASRRRQEKKELNRLAQKLEERDSNAPDRTTATSAPTTSTTSTTSATASDTTAQDAKTRETGRHDSGSTSGGGSPTS